MKPQPHVVFKDTDKKIYWRYENGKEDKSRRKAIPSHTKRQVSKSNSDSRYYPVVLALAIRGYSAVHTMVEYLIERKEMLSILVYTLGFFIAGFFAAKGMRFESLLSAVVTVLVSGYLSGGKK